MYPKCYHSIIVAIFQDSIAQSITDRSNIGLMLAQYYFAKRVFIISNSIFSMKVEIIILKNLALNINSTNKNVYI